MTALNAHAFTCLQVGHELHVQIPLFSEFAPFTFAEFTKQVPTHAEHCTDLHRTRARVTHTPHPSCDSFLAVLADWSLSFGNKRLVLLFCSFCHKVCAANVKRWPFVELSWRDVCNEVQLWAINICLCRVTGKKLKSHNSWWQLLGCTSQNCLWQVGGSYVRMLSSSGRLKADLSASMKSSSEKQRQKSDKEQQRVRPVLLSLSGSLAAAFVFSLFSFLSLSSHLISTWARSSSYMMTNGDTLRGKESAAIFPLWIYKVLSCSDVLIYEQQKSLEN